MRKFRTWVKAILFLSSYVPLFFIMGLDLGSIPPLVVSNFPIPHVDYNISVSWISITVFIVCILLTGILYRLISIHSSRGVRQKSVDTYQQRNELLSTYLLVYVFVFAGLDYTQLLDFSIFVIFFVMLGVLQIRSEMLHVNPMLGFRGYRIYEIRSGSEVMLVISDSPIEQKLISPESHTPDQGSGKIELVNLGPTTYLAP